MPARFASCSIASKIVGVTLMLNSLSFFSIAGIVHTSCIYVYSRGIKMPRYPETPYDVQTFAAEEMDEDEAYEQYRVDRDDGEKVEVKVVSSDLVT